MDDKTKSEMIDSLSDAAKRRYYSLSEEDKQKFLKKAEKLTETVKTKRIEKKSDIKTEQKVRM
ncbi:MAG: hypothetical protein K6G11_06345 [Lachnospiraceae bacterium]|nr:hypothetical protein [Lachnospiraceae bacterium]